MEWLLEDCRMIQNEENPWDPVYAWIKDASWTTEALVVV
jgi:hypothetical protein